jgi:carbonic anhydrase/acetyltransferase-like protein (isoleucine patch superfamily)
VLVTLEVHSSIVLGGKTRTSRDFKSTAVEDKTSIGHMSVVQCGIVRRDECSLCGTDSVLLLLEFLYVLQSSTAVLFIGLKFVWAY